ncbi:hypothetical protein GKZ68_21455 (plasmid) [Hymenobacter sp. BRD128]|uniref:hypothetical protein n=1 Tax=Hymenobacter sp. BRD128 TaxID=2675878 RepID=UPI001566DA38|nr:hypothetical protein [Hymenobacter sp. BRD128]QKG59250.1 hypothetical protein GKZ68_21455 [Hymenobacter sp. BRD128]
MGVIAAGSALGQLAVQVGTHMAQAFVSPAVAPAPDPDRDPAGWLPPALLAVPGPAAWVTLPGWPAAQVLVQRLYCGLTLYHCPAYQLLYCQTAPGTLTPVPSRAALAALVAQVSPAPTTAEIVARYVPGLAAALDEAPGQTPGGTFRSVG